MRIAPHDLDHEFPDLAERRHELCSRDESLAALCADYERVNAEIVEIEEQDKPFEDFAFEDLKKRRLYLKDQIFAILRANRG